MEQKNPNKRKGFWSVGLLFFVFAFLGAAELSAQQKQITGTVSDSSGPMPGVSVTVQGTSRGTITGADGRYTLGASATETLNFSFMGYDDVSVAVGVQSAIDVTMTEAATDLDEIVVIGYGAVRKRDLTGAVQSVKSDVITMAPTGNVMEALQGRVAGLDITRSDGRAKSDVSMTLRGNRSINGTNDPLFIIDGVAGNYNDLNPNDIQSVEVLKDASSTAIYGSAGANGVIIVTTKSGQKGKVTINFDAYYGINGMLKFPPVRMGQDYIDLRVQAAKNDGTFESVENSFSGAEWDAIQNDQWIDWFDLGTRDGTLQNYSISMSGGNEKTTGYFSANYYKEEGILLNDDNTRYSFKTNVDHKVNNWLSGGLNVISAFNDMNERRGQYFTRVLCVQPLGVPYNPDGSINTNYLSGASEPSPILDTDPQQYDNNTHRLAVNPTAYLEIKPVKGLSVKTLISGYLVFSRNGFYKGPKSSEGIATGNSSAQIENKNEYNYRWENIVNYNFMLGTDHSFVLTGVTSWEKKQKEESLAYGVGLSWDDYKYHNLGATSANGRKIDSEYEKRQSMAYIGRVNYSYKGKYLVTLSTRYEASSILAKDNRWHNFPAAAIAWRISDEPFMSKFTKIDNLKLRVGYGVTGNAGADPYATQEFGEAASNFAWQDNPAPVFRFTSTLANRLLGWEKSYNTNVGIDLGMFRGRLNASVDFYHTKTKDILYKLGQPHSLGGANASGFTTWKNVCSMVNRGLEVLINSTNIQKGDFTWTTALTFSTNHEEITSLPTAAPVKNPSTDYYLIKGKPLNTIYTYRYMGIWQTSEADEVAKMVTPSLKPGDVKVEDVNGDYKYDANDYQALGSPTPKWIAGIGNTFTYKGVDLSFFFDARWGQKMNFGLMGWYNPSGQGAGPAMCDYWTEENPGGRFPAPRNSSFNNLPVGKESLFIIDGSYVKLRNVTLGYTLPNSLIQKVGLSKVRVYGTITNPWIYTKSKYLKDYDPERGGADEFPIARQMVFGVNISF